MVYTPREIKDRVAVGDDIFQVEDLGNNRIRLIPAPTHVSEPGTPINKALLQPIEDELGTLSATKMMVATGTYMGSSSTGTHVVVGFAPKIVISFGIVNGELDDNMTVRLPTGCVNLGKNGVWVHDQARLTSTGFYQTAGSGFSDALEKLYHWIAIG